MGNNIFMAVQIQVLDKATRKPVENVLVRIESGQLSETDYTNSAGVAEFDTITDGKYIVKIRHPNYRPYTEKMFISRNSIINIKLQRAYDHPFPR